MSKEIGRILLPLALCLLLMLLGVFVAFYRREPRLPLTLGSQMPNAAARPGEPKPESTPRPASHIPQQISVGRALAADRWVNANSGNDSNNGLDIEHAFRTIQRAADVAGEGATVHILPGIYRESVRPAQSGTASAPILYRAENGLGTVSVRGSEPASSLTWNRMTHNDIGLPPGVDPGNIFYANLSAWGLAARPRFLVELDNSGNVVARLEPAREPDWQAGTEWKVSEFWWMANGGSAVAGCDPTTNADPQCDTPSRSYTELTDTSNDVNPAGIEPGNLTTLGGQTGATLVALDAQHATYVYRRTIIAHDVVRGRVTVGEGCDNDGQPGLGWGTKYYVENHPALLDRAGEWWFNVQSGYLYLWPPGGHNPSDLNLEISRLDDGFDLTDRSFITVDGLTIELYNETGYKIRNLSPRSKAYGDTLRNATVRYANYGVILYDYVSGEMPASYALDGFLLEGSEIAYMDTAGIVSSFWWPGAPSPVRFSYAGVRNTVLRNNELHHLGFNSETRSAVGMRFMFPDRLTLEGNHLHHVAQNGVHLHMSLDDAPKQYGFSPDQIRLGEILIKGNVFEQACQLASDCGAVKFNGSRPFTHVFRDVLVIDNVFRDTFGWSYVSILRKTNQRGDGNGLYLDYATGIHAYRNIAYNNTGAGFKLACLWRDGDSVFYNNIAANNYLQGFDLTGIGNSCDDHGGSVNTQLLNNILVNNNAHAIDVSSAYNQSTYGNLTIDFNLYYQNGWNDQAASNPADLIVRQGSLPAQYFHTLAEVQAGTSWEDHGGEADPRFLHYDTADHDPYDRSWPDFHTTPASSSVLDQGTVSLPSSLARLLLLFDVPDIRLGNAFDIGSYEAAGLIASPASQTIPPAGTTSFILSVYPPSFSAPLTLTIACPDPLLICSPTSAVLDPGETVTLTIVDSHDPSTPLGWPAWYAINLSAAYGGGTQNTTIRLYIGANLYLPLVTRMAQIDP